MDDEEIKLPDCNQGYTYDSVLMEFGSSDDDMNKCNGCNHLHYNNGVMSCDYCERKA